MKDAIYQFIFATIAPATLYFLGWAYLYFYLGWFNIDISEVDPNITTVLTYGYSPIYALRWWTLVPILGLAIAGWIAKKKSSTFETLLTRLRCNYTRVKRRTPSEVALLLGVIFILFIFPWALLPLANRAATSAAEREWQRAPTVKAVLEQDRKSAPDDAAPEILIQYGECSHRPEQLRLIFANSNRYFLLCVSKDYDNLGTIYEIERGKGLESVRSIQRTIEGRAPQ